MVSDIILVSFSAVSCREESKWREFSSMPELPGPTVHCTGSPESKDPRFLDHLAPNLWSSMEVRQPARIPEVGIWKLWDSVWWQMSCRHLQATDPESHFQACGKGPWSQKLWFDWGWQGFQTDKNPVLRTSVEGPTRQAAWETGLPNSLADRLAGSQTCQGLLDRQDIIRCWLKWRLWGKQILMNQHFHQASFTAEFPMSSSFQQFEMVQMMVSLDQLFLEIASKQQLLSAKLM